MASKAGCFEQQASGGSCVQASEVHSCSCTVRFSDLAPGFDYFCFVESDRMILLGRRLYVAYPNPNDLWAGNLTSPLHTTYMHNSIPISKTCSSYPESWLVDGIDCLLPSAHRAVLATSPFFRGCFPCRPSMVLLYGYVVPGLLISRRDEATDYDYMRRRILFVLQTSFDSTVVSIVLSPKLGWVQIH